MFPVTYVTYVKRVFLLITFTALLVFIYELKFAFIQNDGLAEPLKKSEPEFDVWSDNPYNEDLIVIYNRIPKTGSTSFVNIAYDLCRRNKFNVIHMNITKNSHTLSLPDQARLVWNVTRWTRRKPALYHGHVGFIDFNKFSIRQPVYINILRRPLDRFVSYYYFLRYGDDYRPHLTRRRHGDKLTFDDCVKLKNYDCDFKHMWLQIPFLCGQSPSCWTPGNAWALEEAKRNLLGKYMLVGVTEDISSFVFILEQAVPTFFRGATQHFQQTDKKHLRKTLKKVEPSSRTVQIVRNSTIWQMENDLYEFALQQFQYLKEKFANSMLSPQFKFEKIYPK